MLGADGSPLRLTRSTGRSVFGGIFRYEPSTGISRRSTRSPVYDVADVHYAPASFTRRRTDPCTGISTYGGLFERGTVFRVSPGGEESISPLVHGRQRRGWPFSGLTMASDGALYGTAPHRGEFGAGVVFRIDPAALPEIASVSPWSGPAAAERT
jgi:hypothetical protein